MARMGMGNEGSGAGWGFDTSFGRVVRGACAAWSRSKPLSLVIGLARLYLADDNPVLRAFEDDVVRLQAMLGAGPSASEAGDEA
ncbi:MAG: hypothetical protein ACK4VM_12280 [Bosea sp. (in: a-proteobacteria)]